MKVQEFSGKILRIEEAEGLDPIHVFIQDVAPGKGRIILECYGQAWSAFWPAMGNWGVAEFFENAGSEYLLGCLLPPLRPRAEKRYESYLLKIIEAVQKALREVAREAGRKAEREMQSKD